MLAERLGDRLDDYRDVGERRTLARLEGHVVGLAPAHHAGHVDLDHGVGVGDGLLDLGHLARDGLAHLREGNLRVAG